MFSVSFLLFVLTARLIKKQAPNPTLKATTHPYGVNIRNEDKAVVTDDAVMIPANVEAPKLASSVGKLRCQSLLFL